VERCWTAASVSPSLECLDATETRGRTTRQRPRFRNISATNHWPCVAWQRTNVFSPRWAWLLPQRDGCGTQGSITQPWRAPGITGGGLPRAAPTQRKKRAFLEGSWSAAGAEHGFLGGKALRHLPLHRSLAESLGGGSVEGETRWLRWPPGSGRTRRCRDLRAIARCAFETPRCRATSPVQLRAVPGVFLYPDRSLPRRRRPADRGPFGNGHFRASWRPPRTADDTGG